MLGFVEQLKWDLKHPLHTQKHHRGPMGKHSSHQQIYPIMAIRLMIIPDLRKGETTKSPRKAAGASAILLKSMGHGQRESSG